MSSVKKIQLEFSRLYFPANEREQFIWSDTNQNSDGGAKKRQDIPVFHTTQMQAARCVKFLKLTSN